MKKIKNILVIMIVIIFFDLAIVSNISYGAENMETNNTLKELKVLGYDIYPEFNKNTTTYYLTIPTDVSEVEVEATPENEKAKYNISGTKITKKEGEIRVTVTPVRGSKKTYIINVSKQNDNSLKLQKLEIENATISPEFSENKYFYNVEIAQMEIKPLTIIAEANNDDAQIEIVGNDESLVEGDNIISIILTEGDKFTTYELNVNITKQFTIQQVSNQNRNMFEGIKNNITDFFSQEKNVLACLIAVSVLLIIVIITVIIKIKRGKNRR